MHVDQEERHAWLADEHRLLQDLVAGEVPVMGVCLGGQLLAKALGGKVRRLPSPEIGWADVDLTPEAKDDPVFGGLPERFTSFQWHLYHFELPEGAVPLARNERCLQAFRAGRAAWGIQFHAEITHEDAVDWARSVRPCGGRAGRRSSACWVETEELIAGWNAFGRELCGRFLAAAETSQPAAGATTRATSPRS